MSLLIEKILKLISYSRSTSKPKDGYKYIASRVFNKPEYKITKEERTRTKIAFFQCVYPKWSCQ